MLHNNTRLKMRIKQLAAMTAIIRLEERKKLRIARYINTSTGEVMATMQTRGHNNPIPEQVRHVDRLRSARAAHEELHLMRVTEVRPECRAAQIAYAYLRHRPLDQIEITAKNAPKWSRVAEIAHEHAHGRFSLGDVHGGLATWIRKSRLDLHLRPSWAK